LTGELTMTTVLYSHSWALVLIFLCGCGSGDQKTYPAGGTVKFADGTPLVKGTVQFRSLDTERAVSARGTVKEDGTFELSTFEPGDGAVPGEHQAMVLPPPFIGDLDEVGHFPRIIDPKHTKFDTSGLKFTVTPDADQNQFHITVDK
jgi:hypothetical protein